MHLPRVVLFRLESLPLSFENFLKACILFRKFGFKCFVPWFELVGLFELQLERKDALLQLLLS